MTDQGRDGANGHHTTDQHHGHANGHNETSRHGDTPVDISVATSPKDLDSVQALLKQLNAGIMNLTESGEMDHELRQTLSTKARDLMLALETPRETTMKHIWGEVSNHSTVTGGLLFKLANPGALNSRGQPVPLLGVLTVAYGNSWPATATSPRKSSIWPRSLGLILSF